MLPADNVNERVPRMSSGGPPAREFSGSVASQYFQSSWPGLELGGKTTWTLRAVEYAFVAGGPAVVHDHAAAGQLFVGVPSASHVQIAAEHQSETAYRIPSRSKQTKDQYSLPFDAPEG